jgi:hypothetical protein
MKIVLSTYATFPGDGEPSTAVHNVPVTEWVRLTRGERIATATRIAAADLSATKCGSKATSYGWLLTVDGATYAEGDGQLTPNPPQPERPAMTTTPQQHAEDARQSAMAATTRLLEVAQETLSALESGDLTEMPSSSSVHSWSDLAVQALDRLAVATVELPEA